MKRLYSLYEKRDGRWIRLSEASYIKQTAIRVFQSDLLNGFFEGRRVELRPVRP